MGAERRVVFVTGAAIAIGEDQKTVSAIRSYPNRIPMPEHATRTILDVLEPYGYDRLYGSFGQVVEAGARHVARTSLERRRLDMRRHPRRRADVLTASHLLRRLGS